MFFLFFLFSFINLCVLDYVIWWSVFVVCTFFFLFLIKDVSCSVLVNYYIIQEVCGYYFLVFSNWKWQFFVLMMKSGSAPFHFWLFSVTSFLKKWFVLWFLTLQKLPYFVVLINFCSDVFFIIIFFGMIFCYLQFFLLRDIIDMVVVYSTESFNWLLFLGFFSFFESLYFAFFYYIVMFFVIMYVYGVLLSFFSVEFLFVFFNVPLSVTFFLKLLLLLGMNVFVGVWYLFILFFMIFFSLGIGYLIFYLSMYGFIVGIKFYDYFCYILLSFMLLCFF
uniref:NADH dehydrogenase subunit 2 n=1 Tax=Gongylonema pulchrum TaxID=637853 RepID=A0A0D3MTF4_9BILA|nr:NADH dehydrogenase subunit 2 [Gongylonema pulchrum]AIY56394.1 NADH dehydrogenase subunit 2 [Gongylonema pulchrum]